MAWNKLSSLKKVERCPYVLSNSHREPEAREPAVRPVAAPRFHSVHPSPEQRAHVTIERRSLASARSRGKPAFSDEDNESEGEFEKEPQLPRHRQSAASVAAAHRPVSSWASDLTGTVTPSNILHWGSPQGYTQSRHKPPAARRIISSPAGALPPRDEQGTAPSSPPPLNPPSANPSAKRSTALSPTTSSKKARQDGQTASEEDAPTDIDEDLK